MAGEKFDSKSFNPQAFGAYTERIPNLKKNELIKSRALKGNQDIKKHVQFSDRNSICSIANAWSDRWSSTEL